MNKKLFIAIPILAIAAVGIVLLQNNQIDNMLNSTAMCYQYIGTPVNGHADREILRIAVDGDGISGSYEYIPAEKDSKTGDFVGQVGPMKPETSSRTADVSWNVMAEGMRATEQLRFEFGEGSAVAMFGEMVDMGDGSYGYKDVAKLTPGSQMSQVDCDSL